MDESQRVIVFTPNSDRPQITTDKVEDVVERIGHLMHQAPDLPVLVLIGGCSQAGKSWLAEAVRDRLTDVDTPCLIVGLDDWLIGLDQRRPESCVMERYDCAAIQRDINSLLQGRPIYPPVYDTRTRRRVSEASSVPIQIVRGVLIVEGVIALALPHSREKAALKIFVSVEDSTRWTRLLSFYCDFKGVDQSEAEQTLREREMEEMPFARATQAWADLVFQGDGRNNR